MEALPHPDCVIIGYNDFGLEWVDKELKPMDARSGAYQHFRSNTVVYKGKRRHYMDLMNTARAEAGGGSDYLHVAKTPNLACCLLKSFLQKRGISSEIVNFFNRDKDRLVELLSLKPSAAVITSTLYTEGRPIREICDFIRQHSPETRTIIGGPHIFNLCSDNDPANQDYLFREMGGDVFVFDSQGELTLSRILGELRNRNPDLSRIPNLVFRANGGSTATPSFERDRS